MMNIPRLTAGRTAAHLNALTYARGGELPFELFDAVALSEEEAEVMQTAANIQRQMQEEMKQRRG